MKKMVFLIFLISLSTIAFGQEHKKNSFSIGLDYVYVPKPASWRGNNDNVQVDKRNASIPELSFAYHRYNTYSLQLSLHSFTQTAQYFPYLETPDSFLQHRAFLCVNLLFGYNVARLWHNSAHSGFIAHTDVLMYAGISFIEGEADLISSNPEGALFEPIRYVGSWDHAFTIRPSIQIKVATKLYRHLYIDGGITYHHFVKDMARFCTFNIGLLYKFSFRK